jgi:hypothetical protein
MNTIKVTQVGSKTADEPEPPVKEKINIDNEKSMYYVADSPYRHGVATNVPSCQQHPE